MPVDADITFKHTVKTQIRLHDEPFKPTRIYSETFVDETNTDNYLADIETVGNKVWNYVYSEKLNGLNTVDLHFSITLSNATHPPVAKGVVPLAKGHRDAKLDHLELITSQSIKDVLTQICADLIAGAKY